MRTRSFSDRPGKKDGLDLSGHPPACRFLNLFINYIIMKKCLFLYSVVAMSLISLPAVAQSSKDTTSLGLPGDNLDLYAVMDLFLKSKTIEGFEKSLNDTKSGINNLDLNLDKKIDFIKAITEKKGDSYLFTLQVPVSEKENQDVAVILVDKDKEKKVTVQIVGDPDLYGKDYVIQQKHSPTH